MYTKYEVSMSNPVLGRGVCTDDANIYANDGAQRTNHDCIRLFG